LTFLPSKRGEKLIFVTAFAKLAKAKPQFGMPNVLGLPNCQQKLTTLAYYFTPIHKIVTSNARGGEKDKKTKSTTIRVRGVVELPHQKSE
jgi:hypothetical protein